MADARLEPLALTPEQWRTTGCAGARSAGGVLFAALNSAAGQVIGKVAVRYAVAEGTAFLSEIDRRVPPDLAVHLIFDNLAARKTWPCTAGC